MESEEVYYISYHHDKLEEFFSNDKYRTFMAQGSSRSAKTYSICQKLIEIAIERPKIEIAVCRYEATTVRKTIFKDLRTVVSSMNLNSDVVKVNKSEMVFEFWNGATISCVGMSDPDKLKGFKSDIAFIDEALDVSRESYDQLSQRCSEKVLLAFNPSLTQHFMMDSIKHLNSTLYSHSTYKNNPFLTQPQIDKIESYDPSNPENVENGTADLRMHKIYALGEPQGRDNLIYSHFKYVPDSLWPTTWSARIFGIDYGWSDKTAVVEVILFDDTFYARTHLYESNLVITSEVNPNNIVSRLEKLGLPKNEMWVADGSRPEAIQAMRDAGFNCHAVKKGPGSIMAGIETVRSKKVCVLETDWLRKEAEGYVFKTDITGRQTHPVQPDPKCEDHACFTGDTLVTTKRGEVRIDSLLDDDLVLNENGWQEMNWHGYTGTKEIWQITFNDGTTLKVTGNHKIYTRNGKKRVDTLRCGEIVHCVKQTNTIKSDVVVVVAVKNLNKTEKVYNLNVHDSEHQYYANGIKVANCDSFRYALVTLSRNIGPVKMNDPRRNQHVNKRPMVTKRRGRR